MPIVITYPVTVSYMTESKSTRVAVNTDLLDHIFDVTDGLTQARAAAMCGVSEKTLWSVMNGAKAKVSTVEKIAKGFSVEMEQLLDPLDIGFLEPDKRRLDLGRMNPWDGLREEELREAITRIGAEGWELDEAELEAYPMVATDLMALLSQQEIKSPGNPKTPMFPIWFVQHGLSCNEMQVSELTQLNRVLEELIENPPGFSSSLEILLSCYEPQNKLDEIIEEIHGLNLHILGGLIITPILFNPSYTSRQVMDVGNIKQAVLIVASTRYSSVRFSYPKWKNDIDRRF